MKYKNIYKQSAYEKFLEKKGGFLDENSPFSRNEFEKNYWKKALKYSRAEAKIGKSNYEISKNAEILLDEFMNYKYSKIKFYESQKDTKISFSLKYENFEYDTELGRYSNFIKIHGNEKIEGATLLNWLLLYKDGFIDKNEWYRILKSFKENNKDSLTGNYRNRSEDYNPSDYGLSK